MRVIEAERDAEALARACGQPCAVMLPKLSWVEWLTTRHDFDLYPQPAKKTLQTRFGPLVWFEEQRTAENIPTPHSPLPEHWQWWLDNPVAVPAADDSGSEEVEAAKIMEVDDSDEAGSETESDEMDMVEAVEADPDGAEEGVGAEEEVGANGVEFGPIFTEM